MSIHRLLAASLLLLAAAACEARPAADAPAAAAVASADGVATADLGTVEGRIASAMAAAPQEIASGATIVEVGADGALAELRAGTNGWLCMPDNPNTPGPDPMCADQAWQQWFGAYMERSAPQISQVGTAYMLAGGADASNSDPFAAGPAAGQQWIISGPHIMTLPVDPAQLAGYPTEPGPGRPYVMWAGTPYAHLMVPVGAK